MLGTRRIAKVLISLIFVAGIMGCQAELTEEESFIRAQQFLNSLKSYSTIVVYQIVDEDETREYRFRQWVEVPDKFKIEMLFPENLEGKVIISDGKQIYMNHPKVQDSIKLDVESVKQQRPLFIGDFLNAYWLCEEVIKEKKEENGEQYLVLSCTTAKTENSREKKSIWLNARTLIPVKMVEYDEEGKISTLIRFEDFDAKWKGTDDFFVIPG